MNPWDVIGWLVVVIVGLFLVSIVILLILFIVAGILGGIESMRKKRSTRKKYQYMNDRIENEIYIYKGSSD